MATGLLVVPAQIPSASQLRLLTKFYCRLLMGQESGSPDLSLVERSAVSVLALALSDQLL